MAVQDIVLAGFGSTGSKSLIVTIGFAAGVAPPLVIIQPSGGYYETGQRRSKEDIRAERVRLGIFKEPKAVEAVQQVATAVIEASRTALALKEQEQAAMLRRMLKERGVTLEARINAVLTAIIAAEVERQRQESQDWQIIMLMEGM